MDTILPQSSLGFRTERLVGLQTSSNIFQSGHRVQLPAPARKRSSLNAAVDANDPNMSRRICLQELVDTLLEGPLCMVEQECCKQHSALCGRFGVTLSCRDDFSDMNL